MEVFRLNLHYLMIGMKEEPTPTPRIAEGFPGERLILLPGRTLEALAAHPIAQRLYPARLGFFPEARGHYIERPNGVPEHLLFLCLKGAGCLRSEGRKARMEAPAYAWLRAGQPHQYAADQDRPWTLAWGHLGGSDAEAFLRETGPPVTAHAIHRGDLARERFERLHALMEGPDSPATRLAVHTAMANLLAGLALGREAHADFLNPRRQCIDRVLRHLRDNLHRPVPLAEMAAVAGWTTSHFAAVFRDVLRDTPASCFLHMKMARACEQLRASNASVAQIADSLGFDDAFYFSRCFRRCYRLSPSQYRKTCSEFIGPD